MIAAGLARAAEDNRPMRDFFFDRLMFPIADGRGRFIAFGGRGLNPDAKPKYINSGESSLFSKGFNLYNFHTARAAAIKAGAIILAEGYMDVIALVRAGFAHAVAPLGTALTEDQLHLLWRTAPEPILAFDGDAAGLKAAHRAAHLALPHLRPGQSLRFAFLPPDEDPDSFIAHNGAGAMTVLLNDAIPLSQLLWRMETEGKDLSTPERRAGLEQALKEITGRIADDKVRDYYRDGFRELVFNTFKKRPPAQVPPGRGGARPQGRWRGDVKPRPLPGSAEAVSPILRESRLVRASTSGARETKEREIGRMLVADPGLATRHAEALAELAFLDPQLDSLRRELLNLAASGSSLEKAGVQTHFARKGMADLLVRFAPRALHPDTVKQAANSEPDVDVDIGFLNAAKDLRELVSRPSGRVA
jgi:DNA primase